MNALTAGATAQEAAPPQGERPALGVRANDPRLRRRAILPIAGALGLLLGICGVAAFLGVASQHDAAAARHEELIEDTAGNLRDLLLGAEASERSYLMTGQAANLAPYQAALVPMDEAMARLDDLVRGDGVRAEQVQALHRLVARKRDDMQHAVTLARGGQGAAARDLAVADIGRPLSEEIRAVTRSLRQSVVEARQKATARQSRSIYLLMAAIALAAAGAILMAVLAVREVQHHLVLLRRRERQLDQLVASLEARVARRTKALEEANQRFQIALESSKVTVFSQDRDLVYGWISQGYRNWSTEEIVGRTDGDFAPAETAAQLDRLKRAVIATGETARSEVRFDVPPSALWYDITLVPTLGADGRPNGLIGGAVDISERKQFEAHVRLLMRELTHRSKNLLAVIQALMRQTASYATSLEDFSVRFTARLESLAAAHDLLIKDDWRGTTLEELVRSQLSHYTDKQTPQIEITGPVLRVPPDATQNIGMALHELATNAAKFGALSVPAGRVRVHWDLSQDAQGITVCTVNWQESGGPPVSAPARRGFGQVVIERTVARAVSGTVTLAYDPAGLSWTLRFPVRD